ncbi:MAG: UDP-N-acetylmuramyl-tripeptide synthetase, partial [Clostridiales bacterium]|nr:UDP-N-acetylmuramyl-tripeptide synthetase [Clostridiales bacterium]
MIRVDSRKVNKGDIFVAIKGFAADGHDYIPQAVERGAVEIVCERAVEGVAVPQRVVKNARLEAARLAADFFGHPSERFKLIGVTGTNGKTTTTYMIKAILESRKAIVGLIGTNQNMIGDKVVPTERTTPESVELQELFAKMADEGCEYVVMEVSSHALVLDRVAYSGFEVGAFTNLTQDHLDFHADMEEYFNAKVKLLDMSRHVVVNVDDEWGRSIKGEVREVSGALAQNSKLTREGMEYVYKGELIKVAAVGGFNLQNTLLAIGVAEELGYTLQEIVSG